MPIIAKDLSRDDASARATGGRRIDFEFVPNELAEKCRQLVEGYHALHGYACLPDMLWQGGARKLIEDDRQLGKLFRRAGKQRLARQANEAFAQIATTICAVEILARDFGGWGARFPAARRLAERLVAAHPAPAHASLLDMYLYAQLQVGPAVVDPPGAKR